MDLESRSPRRDAPLLGGDEPLDVQRYTDAIRRGFAWIVAIVVLAVAIALAASFLAEKRYRASTRLVYEPIGTVLDGRDIAWIDRELATLSSLAETPAVLERAAVTAGIDSQALEDRVETSVDADTNILTISATDPERTQAARSADAVASAFLAMRQDVERSRLTRARAALQRELDRLEAAVGSGAQTEALRTRISELGVLIASAGSDIRIAQRAETPSSAYTPRPIRNAAVALFASLFFAIMLVLGREHVRPRVSAARELSRLLDLPILARIPLSRKRDRRSGIFTGAEYDAYQALQAALRFHAPQAGQHIVLVTSAVQGEGKSTVCAGLGVTLARSGAATLLISADLRSPTLHEFFGVAPRRGLADVLAARSDPSATRELLEETVQAIRSNLGLLGNATKRTDATSLLSNKLGAFFEVLRQLPYDYVVLDGPPLLGLADSRLLAQYATSVAVVGRLNHVRPEEALDLRDALDTLAPPVVGLIVVGARDQAPYYMAGGSSILERA